jgi:hypothetical protein
MDIGEQPANLQQLHFLTAQKDLVVNFDSDRFIVKMHDIPNSQLP